MKRRGASGRSAAGTMWFPAPGSAPSRLAALLVAGVTTGCASSAPIPPGSPPAHSTHCPGIRLMEPHWDQVCTSETEAPFLNRVAQVLDPDGLEDRLQEALRGHAPGRRPGEGPVQDTGRRIPFVDLAVSYDRAGAIRTAHLLGASVEAGAARVVEELLVSRLRSPGRLLERVDLRVRASLEPAPGLAILPPLRCLPHITHHEDLPPRFLGDARVTGGGLHFAARDGLGVSVRLHVSAEGVLERIEFRAGNEELLGRVEASLAETEFDPALRNGEPVAGTLALTFHFPT